MLAIGSSLASVNVQSVAAAIEAGGSTPPPPPDPEVDRVLDGGDAFTSFFSKTVDGGTATTASFDIEYDGLNASLTA